MLNGRTLSIGFVMAILSATQAVAGDGQVLQILVSRNLQSLKVYDGDKVVATSKVSTGKPGHDTPTGIFSVLEKQKFHRSNKYSDAPMPWMQRITWSGVALHESNSVPNYPASHGCVRMPAAFAQELYKMTERGAHVIITDAPVTPERVRSAMLPRPADSPAGPAFMSDVAMTPVPAQNLVPGTELAMNDAASQSKMTMRPDKPREPIYVLITRADHRSVMPEVQALLNQFGYDAGVVDGAAGTQTNAAIAKFRKDNGLPDGVMADDALVAALFAKPADRYRKTGSSWSGGTLLKFTARRSPSITNRRRSGRISSKPATWIPAQALPNGMASPSPTEFPMPRRSVSASSRMRMQVPKTRSPMP